VEKFCVLANRFLILEAHPGSSSPLSTPTVGDSQNHWLAATKVNQTMIGWQHRVNCALLWSLLFLPIYLWDNLVSVGCFAFVSYRLIFAASSSSSPQTFSRTMS
jgi:hypothetical protein